MPLAGTFDVLDFTETLRLLSRPSCTGRLHVRTGPVHATVVIIGGQAAGADLGSGNGGAEARRDWRSLLEDICFEALRAGRGSFEYQPDDTVESAPGPKADLTEVVAAGERRLAEWKEVEGVIPSFDAVPRLNESLRADSMTVDGEQWRFLVAIDGRRSMSGLARRLGVDVLGLCRVIKPLVEDGAVIFEGSDRRPGPRPSVRLDIAVDRLDTEPTAKGEASEGQAPATDGNLVGGTDGEPAATTDNDPAAGNDDGAQASDPASDPTADDRERPATRRRLVRLGSSRSLDTSPRPAGATPSS
jgi:hypothetical protein